MKLFNLPLMTNPLVASARVWANPLKQCGSQHMRKRGAMSHLVAIDNSNTTIVRLVSSPVLQDDGDLPRELVRHADFFASFRAAVQAVVVLTKENDNSWWGRIWIVPIRITVA